MSNRRALITYLTGGAIAGIVTGFSLKWLRSDSTTMLGVLGNELSQIWLLDTLDSRTLIAFGPENDRLLDNLPALATIDRQRIDMLIAESSLLASRGSHLVTKHAIQHVLAIQANADGPPLPLVQQVVSDYASIEVSESVSLRMAVVASESGDAGSSSWYVAIEMPSYNIGLCSDARAVNALPDKPLLIGAPKMNSPLDVTGIVVANEVQNTIPGATQFRAQVLDPIWFILAPEHIQPPRESTTSQES